MKLHCIQASSGLYGSLETVLLFSGAGSVNTLMRWDSLPGLVYGHGWAGRAELKAVSTSKALEAFISAGAWEGETSLELDNSNAVHSELNSALQVLEAEGVTKSVKSEMDSNRIGWQITRAGSATLSCGVVLYNCRSVAIPRAGTPP